MPRNTRLSTYRSMVSRENHPELLPAGEGIRRVNKYQTTEKTLKANVIKAQADLKLHQLNKPNKTTSKKVQGR